ncbi:substrate-binding domain-containing protein [Aeromicrobium choanae]|uniref:substrate-binding domain-containing protein n=1 Tax=Aeromicrobium choanae TaxID=1736691 RepID=UPI001560E7B0|nr:substrate-binding domain-containing protein [Aeromicrobium choanae]
MKVGIIVSETGVFSTQAKDFQNGFNAAIEHLTDGTGEVDGHKIEVMVGDDTGDAAVGTAKAKEFLGQGATILAGTTDSAVAVAVAEQAVQNNAMFIGGTAGTTAFVGMDKKVFGTAGSSPAGQMIVPKILGDDLKGKTLVTVDQDYAFGQTMAKAYKAQLEPLGVKVVSYLLPVSTSDFTPTMLKVEKDAPDFITTTWAGKGYNQLLGSLDSQGLLDDATFFKPLLLKSDWAPVGEALGDSVDNSTFYLSYFAGATGNEADEALQAYSKANDHAIEYDDAVGWHAGAMVVRAIQEGGTDTEAMAEALQGHSFEGPAGEVIIRAEDNQVTVPQFTVRLVEKDGEWGVEILDEFTAKELEPPVVNALKQ